MKKIKSQNDCTFLFFNRHEIAHVSWTFYFMKTAKMFQQNQKTVLKKENAYSSVSMNLRIVFKTFQKTDFLPKRLWTAIGANTGWDDDKKKNKKRKKTAENEETLIQNVLKKQKTKIQKLFKWNIENGMNCHQKK